MGWTVHYQILRERPLTDAELVALDDYLTRSNRPPWECEGFDLAVTRDARADRVLGEGLQKLPLDADESEDHARLCETLNGLRAILDGIEIRITDDFRMFGLAGDRVSLAGARGPAPVDISRGDRETFVGTSALVPARAVAPDVTSDLARLLLQYARLPDDHPQRGELEARVAAAPPVEVVLAGFAEYREVSRAWSAWDAVVSAMEQLDDVQPIVEPFLAIWRNPHGIYWYGDMRFPDRTREALARMPAVAAQLSADLDASVRGADSELVHRRAEHAAQMLGLARTPGAIAALIAAARTLRDSPLSSGQRYHTWCGIHVGLARAGVAAAVPTLLLCFDTDAISGFHRDLIRPLARHALERARPILRHLAATGRWLYELGEELAVARDVELLRELAAYPIEADRRRAVETLRALGVSAPEEPLPAPETLVTHEVAAVREAALSALEARKDPALATSIVACHVLQAAVGRRFGGATGSYSSYFELFPESLRFAPHEQQLAALIAGVEGLPPQVILPAVQPILDGKAATIAARYPSPGLRLHATTIACLLDEEATVLAQLRDGVLPETTGPAVILAGRADGPVDPRVIDALLDALARELVPDDEVIARSGLRRDFAGLDRWDREKAIRTRLSELDLQVVGERLLARLPELHAGAGLRELAELVLPAVAQTADGARRLAAAYEAAFDLPWDSPSRAEDYFRPVAMLDELFERARDDVAAPDNSGCRTGTALALLANAGQRGTPRIVARIRADRRKPSSLIGWRADAYRALRSCGDDAVPTAALELAEATSIGRAMPLIEILARTERGAQLLALAVNLPELAYDATRELLRAPRDHDDRRTRYLHHPFWRVRLGAAASAPTWDRTKVETYAVWAAYDAAQLPANERERLRELPSDGASTWEELARAHGEPIALPPLPPVCDGMLSPCADHRAWALAVIDERLDPRDAPARVFADELDATLVAYDHARHPARWTRWRDKVPELPLARRGRLAWAAERIELPAFIALRDRGVEAVAAEMPRPYLVLPAELRAELEELEAKLCHSSGPSV